MELIYIFRILFRRKWIILAVGLTALVASFFLTLNRKDLYKSQAQMSTGFTISEEIKLSDDIFNLPQIDVKFNNVIENITSPKVLNLLSYRLIIRDLSSDAPFMKPDRSKWGKNELLKGINLEAARKVFIGKYDSMQLLRSNLRPEKQLLELLKEYDYDIETIKKYLYVARYQRTDYINIYYRSESPELSAYVVNSLLKEFQRYYDAFRRERSIESMVAMDSMVKKRKAELDEKINAKGRYLNDSVVSTLDPNLVGANKLSQISMYESGLAEELSRVQSLTYQIEQINLQLQSLGESQQPKTEQGNNKEYFELRKEYNDLYDRYVKSGGNDPVMKAKLDDLQRRMRLAAPSGVPSTDNGNNFTSSQRATLTQTRIDLEGQLRSANSKIGFYRTKLGEAGSIISTASPEKSGRLEQLDKEVEVATLEYTNAKERLTLASNMEAGVSNFKQTLYGQPAVKPEPSKQLMVMALAGFSGIVLASLVFIFLAYIDQTIKTPVQFQRMTGLSLLGTVNYVDLKAANLKEQVTQVEVGDVHRNNSFRELLRKLRYEIEISGKRVILFTSTEPQQGKTTLLQALAFSLSLSKKKVLLIDTNFCNNDLTVYNDAKPTLEEYSAAGLNINSDAVRNLITNTGVENVDIIGCRGGDYTPTEILPKDHLLNHLQEFLHSYDYILMEGAPLNGFTDTKELAQYSEGIVAIFSATSEIKPADKESIKYFKTVKGKFLGAVLNKVDSKDINL